MNKRGGAFPPLETIKRIINAIIPDNSSDSERDSAFGRACYTIQNFNPPSFSTDPTTLRDVIKNDIHDSKDPEQAAKAQHLCDIVISSRVIRRKESILRVLRGISPYEQSRFGCFVPIPAMMGGELKQKDKVQIPEYVGLGHTSEIDAKPETSTWGKAIRKEREEKKVNEVKIPVPEKIQEKQTGISSELLCKDVVYTMQGVPGQYIFFKEVETKLTDMTGHSGRNHLLKNDFNKDKVEGVQNMTVFPTIPLTQSQSASIGRCAESGLLITPKSLGMRKVVSEENGICGALISAIEIEKTNYLKVVCTLPNTITVQSEEDGNIISSRPFHTTLTIAESWRPILAYLSALTDKALSSTANEMDLLSDICVLCDHGDPTISTMMNRLFTSAIQPFMNGMRSWCMYGEILGYSKILQGRYNNSGNRLGDPSSPSVPSSFFVKMSNEQETDLWKNRYGFSNSLVPRFIQYDLAQDCYILGKSVSFLRNACNEYGYTIPSELLDLAEINNIFTPDFTMRNMNINTFTKKLRVFVDAALQSVTDAIMKTLFDKFNLKSHLNAIHCFLLLTRSDFAAELHDVIEKFRADPENHRNLNNDFSIPRNRLVAALDGAIRKSSVSSMPKECLDNVDIDLRDILKIGQSQGFVSQKVSDNSVTVPFTLTYVVSPPLNTIIPPEAIDIYELVFRRILSLQISEKTLGRIWSERMRMARLDHILSMSSDEARCIKSDKFKLISKELHKVSLLVYKMHYSVKSIINYAMTEVTHFSLTTFNEDLSKAKSLNDVISAHDRCVKDIGKRLLICTDKRKPLVIQDRAGGSSELKGITDIKVLTEFGENLDNLNQLIFEFDVFCQHLFSQSESEARHMEQARIDIKDRAYDAVSADNSNAESPLVIVPPDVDISVDGKVMGSEEIILNTTMYTNRYNEITKRICNALTAASQLGSLVTGMEGECMEFLSSRLKDGMVLNNMGNEDSELLSNRKM